MTQSFKRAVFDARYQCKNNSDCQVWFGFTDKDCEEYYQTYNEMKQYAKDNYLPEYHDVCMGAFLKNKYYNIIEPIDTLLITEETDDEMIDKFIDEILNEYVYEK